MNKYISIFLWGICILVFIFGGPFGVILSLLLIIILKLFQFNPIEEPKTMKNKVLEAITELSCVVMNADATMKRSELYLFKNFMLQNFGKEAASISLEYLQQIMHSDVETTNACQILNQQINYAEKMQILRFLFQLACADGTLNVMEVNKIYYISCKLRIRQQDFYYLRTFFEYTQNQYQKSGYQNNNSYNQYSNNNSYSSSFNNLEHDYAVLGVKSSDSDETIKKAYRRLAVANHPDKVQHLGETARQEAEKRFSEISQAYNRIKKARGL